MKGGLSKEVVSDEGGVSVGHTTFVSSKDDLTKEVVFQKRWSLTKGEVSVGHTTFVTSKDDLTKEVVFHEGGLSKEVLLHHNR